MYEVGAQLLQKESGITQRQFNFVEKYMMALTREELNESEVDLKKREMLEVFMDEEQTRQLKEKTLPFTQESSLTGQRTRLGIGIEKGEKHFDIKILKPPKPQREENEFFDFGEEMSPAERQDWWEKTTTSPSMFVSRGKDAIPTIYLSQDDAKNLLNQNVERSDSVHKFEHEYRHTQCRFGAENDRLYRFIDEACTNVGGQYGAQIAFLSMLGDTTDSFDFNEIMQAYEKDDDEKKAAVLQKISLSFGPMGLLLLAGKKSSEHSGDHDGISELPLIEEEELKEFPELQFAETLLSLREKIDSQWLEQFRTNITKENITRKQLEATLGYHFRQYTNGVEKGMSPHVRALIDAIKVEIKKRESRGEEGVGIEWVSESIDSL
ncbi:MAG: hypothetical protein HZA35_04000 [Parcubacteria group bacterium]|nr:hypothetical protein [Parcubacteria group bacterium]